jgi:hypothetical protein
MAVGIIFIIVAIVSWYLFIKRSRLVWNKTDAIMFVIAALLLIPVTWYMTFIYTFMSDENTRFIGAPFPAAAFQRSAKGEPWADFVGIGMYIAPVVNYIVYCTCFTAIWTLSSFTRKKKI